MLKKISVSKKKETLYLDKRISDGKIKQATKLIDYLNQYRKIYTSQINENSSAEEVMKSIIDNDSSKLVNITYSKEKKNLQANFANLDEEEVLKILLISSKKVIDNLVSIGDCVLNLLKNSGLTIDNFILNDEFIMNSKVEGRIKNMASIYCANQSQKDLKKLATQLSEIVEKSIKTGLLSQTRLGVNTEDIININTGEINYHYIMHC